MAPPGPESGQLQRQGRFAVLRHLTPSGYPRPDHWDLLLEQPQGLWTWALPIPPEQGTAQAERLPDHRAVYLEYEGPISGGRGTVSRWDQGHYRLLRAEAGELLLQFEGRRLQGRYRLERIGSGPYWRWTRCTSGPAAD